MARLTKEMRLKKEQFVKNLFVGNPVASLKTVQKALKAEFNQIMAVSRIVELRSVAEYDRKLTQQIQNDLE